jgi:5-formyltetrahydrofolate cyclo-ligase
MSDDKSLLRAQCRAQRDAMTGQAVVSASTRVCERLADWPVFQQADAVMAYMAFGNEISLGPLMRRFAGKRWIVPRILKEPEPHLVLHPYDAARLVRHPFGMLEPDASLPVIEPCELDLVLVPGLAFDRRGYRLGLGGGFYDRFLPHVTATTVGIVYAALIVDRVPNDAHDRRVDFVACESAIVPSAGDQPAGPSAQHLVGKATG